MTSFLGLFLWRWNFNYNRKQGVIVFLFEKTSKPPVNTGFIKK